MAYGWWGEGLSSEGEPERISGRADSSGRTYQDDSERSSRRKANEAETGWSQPAHKLQTRPPGKGSRCANFYVAFGIDADVFSIWLNSNKVAQGFSGSELSR